MTRSNGTHGLLKQASQTHDLSDLSTHAALTTVDLDRTHLATLLAFVHREIDQSANMLRDLAQRLSSEFCALSETDDLDTIRQGMLAATIALQNEDRVQQRLRDLRVALSLIERALLRGHPPLGTDLDHSIIDQFDLEEVRLAFAKSVGIARESSAPNDVVGTPSLGDIDLF